MQELKFYVLNFRCVEVFRGLYRINRVQFTLNNTKSFDYFDRFDLETFFTHFLAVKIISDQFV
jgi:hypothetical protein